jgi:hypothetical protein
MKKVAKSKEKGGEVKECLCPYCEEELMLAELPFCKSCSVLLRYCKTCKIVVEKGVENCPRCGAPLK